MKSHLSLFFLLMLLALSSLACGLVERVLEPQSTLAPPPTIPGGGPVPTSLPGEVTTAPGGNPTPTLALTPTTLPLLPVPDTVAGLEQWAAEQYTAGQPLNDVCSALQAAGWFVAGDTCQEADLDGDTEEEWLLTIDTSSISANTPPPLGEGHLGDLWVVSAQGLVYQVFQGDEVDNFAIAPTLLELVDMTGDEQPEAVTVFTTCGAHTCFSNYQILSAHNGPVQNIIGLDDERELELPEGEPRVIALSYVEGEQIEDATGDDLPDLVITGGIVGSAGAGIQRARTETWAWDPEQAAIVLADQLWQETGYRFHHLYNANYAFTQEEYEQARQLYEAVVVDETLEDIDWGGADAQAVRSHSRQFAGFRLSLLPLLQGDITEASRWRNWLQETYPEQPITRAASLLIPEWQGNGNDLAAACQTVSTFLEGLPAPTGPLEDMGYNNPILEAEDVCPFG